MAGLKRLSHSSKDNLLGLDSSVGSTHIMEKVGVNQRVVGMSSLLFQRVTFELWWA